MLKAYEKHEELEWQKLKWAVWHTEALARTKRLPKFEQFIEPPKPKKQKTPEEMLATLKVALGAE